MPVVEQFPAFSDRNLRGEFFKMFQQTQAKSYLGDLSMRVDSDREFEQYGWLGNVPLMREWDGGLQINEPTQYAWTIYNKLYEGTIGLSVDQIRRDKTDNFRTWAASLGKSAALNPVRLMSALMMAGTSALCYDGQFFYDTDHVEGASGTQSNLISCDISEYPVTAHGTTTKPSAEELEYAIIDGVTAMYKLKDDAGEPINQDAEEFVIVAPISIMTPVLSALKNKTFSNGRDGVLQNANWKFKPFFDPRMTWTDRFTISRTDHPVKPFIHQVELDTQIAYLTDPNDSYVLRNRKYLWSATRLEGLGYGDWHKSVMCVLT